MKKTCSLIIIIMLVLFSLSGIVDAASLTASATVSNNGDAPQGETATVTLSLSGFTSELLISAGTCFVSYDENVFEKLSDKSLDFNGNWQIGESDYSERDKAKLTFKSKPGITSDGDILSINFKVRDDAELGETSIRIYGVNRSHPNGEFSWGGSEPVWTSPITKTINIVEAEEEPGEPEEPATYTTKVNNGTANPSTAVAEGTKVTITANTPATGKVFDKWTIQSGGITLADATSAKTTFTMGTANVEVTATYKDKEKASEETPTKKAEELPKTGAESIIIPAIALIAIAGTIFYVRYNRIEK